MAYLEVFHNFPFNRPISNHWFTRISVCCEIGNRTLLPDAVYFSLDYKLLISSKTLELTKVTKERELDHTELTERTVLCSSVYAHSFQLCLTLGDPMNCSLPVSSDHGILQARILEWVAMPSSKGSSQPRDRTCISYIAGRFFTAEPPWNPPLYFVVFSRPVVSNSSASASVPLMNIQDWFP